MRDYGTGEGDRASASQLLFVGRVHNLIRQHGLSYIWQFHDLKDNAYVAEGKCEKIN